MRNNLAFLERLPIESVAVNRRVSCLSSKFHTEESNTWYRNNGELCFSYVY